MTSEKPPKPPHVIFIGGMDLSGSTVVDLALGSLPGVVGLGEVDNILSSSKRTLGEQKNGPVEENTCTCGRTGSECLIWGPLLSFIDAQPESSYRERYLLLLNQVVKEYPGTQYVVDSSKEPEAFVRVVASTRHECNPQTPPYTLVILRRGPLSWLISDSRRASRRGRVRNFRIRRRRLYKWTSRYEQLRTLAGQFPQETIGISLHAFQKSPELIISALRNRFPSSFGEELSINLSETKSHVLWGSHHRHESETKSAVRPQPKESFLKQWPEILSLLLFPTPLKINRKLEATESSS